MPNTLPEASAKADILVEALPYLQAFRGKVVVVKSGGSALGDPALRRGLLRDLVFLSVAGIRPVLVHGGGPDISQRMAAAGRQARFVDGLRVTDAETLHIVVEALQELNRTIVKELISFGGRAVGLAHAAKTPLIAKRLMVRGQDLGYVGEIVEVHPTSVLAATRRGAIPVVWPLGKDRTGQLYNINADQAAADLAAALHAEKLVLVTDVRGILRQPGDADSLVLSVTIPEVDAMIQEGIVVKGMIPKARACVHALKHGVRKTHMVDIKVQHALLLEIFTDRGIGTEILKAS
ncbi:MAG: acetylglutamate kinase [Omnitrophica WOR_2 bacterium RIFCSPHIGHO2_02_FULL_68_15]|nr:MAG: acetylglutamate kinase [Omnitrophica WOR_2 bacterium RIFCSPHIGHO2_02_FULL_68_15]